MTTTDRTLGQVAYEAFAKADEARSIKLLPWDKVLDDEKDAWEAAANAVVQEVFHRNPPETRKAS